MARAEELLKDRFVCSKCKYTQAKTKEVSMSGSGLSKLLDIDYNHFLFVSCLNCGFVEVYNPSILEGKTRGELTTILDILFG
ncbi:zinc ribbon domain-containing protein [Gottfriedia acidiceleris]|uniref:Zinc ribbon domain-containing protein n=1 Tax=Gottfriedia acidiceleris TaxID=371036 RepID=A0ABY4JPT2_9BACI|nr:zinc ribbon domain-containing protein [Gottfriedia acidiceleris]UPM55856.1 zinc ribbon domain-containing protein [Gottfriedia acidiceleris]